LVTQAGSTGALFGFVGGAQTLAVWGLIIIMVAGFAFLALYLRTIMSSGKGKTQKKDQTKSNQDTPIPQGFSLGSLGRALVPFVITATLTSGLTGVIVANVVSKSVRQEMVQGASVTPQDILPTPTVPEVGDDSEPITEDLGEGMGGPYLVVVRKTPTGFLRVRETPGGIEIARVNPGDKLPFVDENDGWYQIELESGEMGWVSKSYSSKE